LHKRRQPQRLAAIFYAARTISKTSVWAAVKILAFQRLIFLIRKLKENRSLIICSLVRIDNFFAAVIGFIKFLRIKRQNG